MKIQISEDVSLKELSTFHIGGKAKYFTIVKNKEELKEAFSFAKNEKLPFFVLGNGSNVLFDDLGFRGLVIHNKIDFLEIKDQTVFVGGGYSFSKLGMITADKELEGLHFAASIPATVGGAIFMNAGAWGLNVSNSLLKVDYLTEDGKEIGFLKNEIKWGYRYSTFHEIKGAILQASFHLSFSNEVKKKMTEMIEKRKNSQPSGFSAGCVFRNGENYFAGELIEKSGLKGQRIGGAVISVKHGNFILNDSNATSQDVLSLISLIKEEVRKKFSFELKEEIRYLPY